MNLWVYYAPTIFFLALICVIGLWGALKVRKDITKLARPEKDEEAEAE